MVKILEIIIVNAIDIHNLSEISEEAIIWTPTSLHLFDILASDS